MNKKYILFFIMFFLIMLGSCSLKYNDQNTKFDKMPNFVFKKTSLNRYENNKIAIKMNFKKLEIYDSEKIWAGETINFIKIAAEDNANILEGKKKLNIDSKAYAGIIKIDENNNKYFLGDKVYFHDLKENIVIRGKAFFWNKKEKILYAPKKDIITVQKGSEFKIKGAGFIANTGSREFEFSDSIEGIIETEEINKESSNEH